MWYKKRIHVLHSECFYVVSHSFGYGMMNAEGMVTLARGWAGLPEQHRCDIVSSDKDRQVPV